MWWTIRTVDVARGQMCSVQRKSCRMETIVSCGHVVRCTCSICASTVAAPRTHPSMGLTGVVCSSAPGTPPLPGVMPMSMDRTSYGRGGRSANSTCRAYIYMYTRRRAHTISAVPRILHHSMVPQVQHTPALAAAAGGQRFSLITRQMVSRLVVEDQSVFCPQAWNDT